MHIHLNPVGGIAGDMFVAAAADVCPDLDRTLPEVVRSAGLPDTVAVRVVAHRDHALTGKRFEVSEGESAHTHAHTHYADIRKRLLASSLAPAVSERAVEIFALLADAEAEVHGVEPEDVSFHEVGAVDSIADIVAAAFAIEEMGIEGCSCDPLPMGSGRVQTAHGALPLPAPAVALLLEGYPVFQDGLQGERITPTGAAILRHLEPSFEPLRTPLSLIRTGMGFGTRVFDGISNVLRLMVFETARSNLMREHVAALSFEIDDQTPEDLAIALDRVRELPGVLDVMQSAGFGKKGRVTVRVQVLVRPAAVERVAAQCLQPTTSLGLRHQEMERVFLNREIDSVAHQGRTLRVKTARRPDGQLTSKVEADDVARVEGGFAERDRLRRSVEGRATEPAARLEKSEHD